MITEWFKSYPPTIFIGHKLTHITVGSIVGFLFSYINIWLAVGLVFAVAVGKEIADQITARTPEWHPPYEFSFYDIVVTCIGGAIGIGISYLVHSKGLGAIVLFAQMGILAIALALASSSTTE